MSMKLAALRKKYPVFVYKGYSYELKNKDLHISYDFAVGDITFKSKVVIKSVPSWLLSQAKQPEKKKS